MPKTEALHIPPKHILQKFEERFGVKRKESSDYINYLFHLILEECSEHGVCPIKGIGNFVMYVAYSGRNKREVIRFKFITSSTLTDKIKYDTFLFGNLKRKESKRINPNLKYNEKNRINNIRSRCIMQNKQLYKKEQQEQEVQDEIQKIISS